MRRLTEPIKLSYTLYDDKEKKHTLNHYSAVQIKNHNFTEKVWLVLSYTDCKCVVILYIHI